MESFFFSFLYVIIKVNIAGKTVFSRRQALLSADLNKKTALLPVTVTELYYKFMQYLQL